ncbi:VENN motif pre-toxin domain-containing protein [Hafnia psychrotolerans]|uniref:VENN motif-containing domain-containing protein n=1 Tax=Hafnia psychrotolerans TaxID=1477018 RepID=A0ABQ1GQD3_9GAMM|nr:VENN motif pre-toxin domain-containing protein [Hafnia psychrotolerans]GGA47604.1 hypothetical protein GCM10011328_23500 [Hafnia psychrotolerans]
MQANTLANENASDQNAIGISLFYGIGSTADASLNKLDTGTLGFSNIKNSAEYEVEHQSVGISSGGNIGDQFAGNMASSLLVGINGSGSDSSTTKAAVSEGTITIRDKDNQKQDVADLSRDVEHANQTLSPIFDKEKEQNRLKEAQLIGEIGSQAMDIARTQGKIEATKAGKAELEKHGVQQPGKDATKEERAAYNKALTETAGYKTAQQKWGTGSAIQQGLQAATAAVQGLAGGDMAKALAGASAPYLAEVIHNMTTDPVTGKVNSEANLMAHAVLGAVVAQVNGNGALAGASGAVMGEYIAQQMYPGVERDKLSEDQRQTLSALSTLAAGLAGGLVGDSTADAVAGAQAGKNAATNNNLAIVRTGAAACAEISVCRDNVIKIGLGALVGAGVATSAMEQLSEPQKTNVMLAAMSGDKALIDNLSPSERTAYEEWKGNQGLITVFPAGEKDLTGDKLENPAQEQNKGTTLVTPDQSGEQGASNTGNTDGAPDVGGNTTTTPIAEQNPDDLAYLAEGRDNRLPIPEPTVASNGLTVESNTKHTPGAQGFRPSAGIEPKNSLELFGNSVSIDGNKARYSIGTDGSIHRYFPDNTGIYHWSGSTSDSKNPMQLDNKTRAQLRKQEGWKIK